METSKLPPSAPNLHRVSYPTARSTTTTDPVVLSFMASTTHFILQLFFTLLNDHIGPTCSFELKILAIDANHVLVGLEILHLSHYTSNLRYDIEYLANDTHGLVKVQFPPTSGSLSLQLFFSRPESLTSTSNELLRALLALHYRSLTRTLHSAAPIAYSTETLHLAAAAPGHSILSSLTSYMTTTKLSITSIEERGCSIEVGIFLDDSGFPSKTINLIHYNNFHFDFDSSNFDQEFVEKAFQTSILHQTGLQISKSTNKTLLNATSLLSTLLTTAQVQFSYPCSITKNSRTTATPKSPPSSTTPEISNVVLILISSKHRSVSDARLVQMANQGIEDASTRLHKDHPQYFQAGPSSSRNQASSASTPPTPKQTSQPRPKEPTKAEDSNTQKPKEKKDRKDKRQENRTTSPSAPPTAAVHASLTPKYQKSAKSTESKPTSTKQQPKDAPSNRNKSATATAPTQTTAAAGSATTAPPSAFADSRPQSQSDKGKKATPDDSAQPPVKTDKKRKRIDADEETPDYNFYLESIVDSISSIVQESQNPDFVSACFSFLGITPTTIPDMESAERTVQFRQILEKDLRRAMELCSRPNQNKHRFTGHTSGGRVKEPLLEQEDEYNGEIDEWLESLTPEELDALWRPQETFPRDSKWSDILWTPCNIPGLDESKFRRIFI